MRATHHDCGWLTADDAEEHVFGIALGFDFCGQHECGTPFLHEQMGLKDTPYPQGVEDRTMTKVPDCLRFFTYEHRSEDKRVKRTMPAALLYCADWPPGDGDAPDVAYLARQLDASFTWDFHKDKKFYVPGKSDMAIAWAGHSGFAIHVRGEENVRRLAELHEAMLACEVSLADAAITGFRRKSLALVLNRRLPQETWDSVRKADAEYLQRYEALAASGIEERLKEKGRAWHVLIPGWLNGPGSELLVYLSPRGPEKLARGWYTVKELEQWVYGFGPVVEGPACRAALDASEGPTWSDDLAHGLAEAGVKKRAAPVLVWQSIEKRAVLVRLLVHKDSEELLASGLHPIAQLRPFIERGRALRESLAATP